MAKIANTYNPLPTTAEGQNSLWYKIYKKNSSDIVVQKSHKEFLLARDLLAMCVLYMLFVALPMLFLDSWLLSLYYFFFLAFEYTLLVRIAQNHCKRFVTNVLAVESSLP